MSTVQQNQIVNVIECGYCHNIVARNRVDVWLHDIARDEDEEHVLFTFVQYMYLIYSNSWAIHE